MELKLDTKNMNMDLEKFNGNQLNGEKFVSRVEVPAEEI